MDILECSLSFPFGFSQFERNFGISRFPVTKPFDMPLSSARSFSPVSFQHCYYRDSYSAIVVRFFLFLFFLSDSFFLNWMYLESDCVFLGLCRLLYFIRIYFIWKIYASEFLKTFKMFGHIDVL